MAPRITKQQDLVPGMLYALFEVGADQNDEQYDRQVALAYWTGSGFADHDSDFEDLYWEWAIAQNVAPDPHFIDQDISDVGYAAGYSYAAGYPD